MNLFLIGIIIFVIVYLFLNWFARTSSKKIATTIKKIAVYFSLILAMLLAIGGKYIFSLPFLFVILSGLKRGCTKEDVLKAANQLQKKIHPDMNRDVKTERLSQLVNEAKEKIIKTDFS